MKVTFNPNDGKRLIFKNANVLFLSYSKVIMTISGVRTELAIGKNVEVLIEEECEEKNTYTIEGKDYRIETDSEKTFEYYRDVIYPKEKEDEKRD